MRPFQIVFFFVFDNDNNCIQMTALLHLCPEMTLIRCTLNFDIEHEVSLKV